MLLTGLLPHWPNATAAQLLFRLQALRVSSLQLPLRLRTFHSLRDITDAAYFAPADCWPAMAYSGHRGI